MSSQPPPPYPDQPSAPGPAQASAQPGYGQPYTPQAGDPGTLDLPYYGIGFVAAFKRGWKKYARFDGRASPSEFWWYALANFCVTIPVFVLLFVFSLIAGVMGSNGSNAGSVIFAILTGICAIALGIYALASIVPGLAIGARRLHDGGYSGWLQLLSIIPLGGFVVLVLWCMPSKAEGQRFDRRS